MSKNILIIGNHLSNEKSNISVSEELIFKFKSLGWFVISVSNKKNKIFRLFDMISTIINKRKLYDLALLDVFSGNAFIWAYLSGLVLKLFNKTFILILHGGNLPVFSKRHTKLVSQLHEWAKTVISPSLYLKNSLEGIRKDIQVIPNPIQINNYKYNVKEKFFPKIIWVRAFHEIYNPIMVPEVILLLINDFPDINLTMVGPDKGDGSLKKVQTQAEKLNVSKYLKIIPGLPKKLIPEILSQNDIFINTTNVDNTPISVIEALASGLCIVSTNVGGIPYLLQNEIDSILVPPNNPELMAKAITRILNDFEFAKNISLNSRMKAETYDWSKVMPVWEKTINEII